MNKPSTAALIARPKRIQRRRTKGWTMPEGAVYVGRPSKWGNPHRVSDSSHASAVKFYFEDFLADPLRLAWAGQIVAELGGKDLACWCPLDKPCHADVLLDIANPTQGESRG